jgi:hypothetical protein
MLMQEHYYGNAPTCLHARRIVRSLYAHVRPDAIGRLKCGMLVVDLISCFFVYMGNTLIYIYIHIYIYSTLLNTRPSKQEAQVRDVRHRPQRHLRRDGGGEGAG